MQIETNSGATGKQNKCLIAKHYFLRLHIVLDLVSTVFAKFKLNLVIKTVKK